MDVDWRELLAPDGPLITQPAYPGDALRANHAYRPPANYAYAIGVALADIGGTLSPGSRHILNGVRLYFNHMAAVDREDMPLVIATVERAEQYREIFNDLGLLARLLTGVANGFLHKSSYVDTDELVRSELDPDGADRVMSRIHVRRRTPPCGWRQRPSMQNHHGGPSRRRQPTVTPASQ